MTRRKPIEREDLEMKIDNYDTAVVLADEHFSFVNEDMVRIAEKYIRARKPKYRIHLGDLFDNPQMSVFSQEHEYKRDSQEEIDEVVRYLARLHKASPDTKTVIIYGNHDYKRLERKKGDNSYGLGSLRNLEYPSLFRESAREQGLEIGDIIFGLSYRLGNCITFTHGDPKMDPRLKGGVTGARRTAEMFPGDDHIIMGHRHRKYVGRDAWNDREVHHVAAMLDPNKTHYTTYSQYENGMCVIHYKPNARPKPEVVIQNVVYRNGGVFIDGKKWTPK